MGLEKYRKEQMKKTDKSWNFGTMFVCPKCGYRCSGKNMSLVNQGSQLARWCEQCNYYEVGFRSQLDYVNLDVIGYRCPGYP